MSGVRIMSNTFDKLSVLEPFIEEVNSYLPEIETNLEHLAVSPRAMDVLEETYRRAHTIGGSASMMDFPGLAHVAHGMEDILGDVLDGLSTLEEPTIELLQRSLGRLRILLNGIRKGVDETAIIAEDDNDYSNYRAAMNKDGRSINTASQQAPENRTNGSNTFDMSEIVTPLTSSMPSFDEVLASFRTPAVASGEEVAWPEEPAPMLQEAPAPQQTVMPVQPSQPLQPQLQPSVVYTEVAPTQATSALDALVASTRQSSPQPVTPISTPYPSQEEEQLVPVDIQPVSQSPQRTEQAVIVTPQALSITQEFPQAYRELQQEAQTVEQQASSFKNIVMHLRAAMSVIEGQRSEFKGFLDGSKDALDRMEDWAGKAMGLNLLNSPEQVRRYLPLSVMWVSNTKLKKVLDLLVQITNGVEMTDEQMSVVLQQLQASIASCGDAFQQIQTAQSLAFTHDQGWTPWEMQIEHGTDVRDVQERVTFERRGDPETLRAELETSVREELRREYESRPLPDQLMSEMEQRIRNEIRREFEAKLRTQERERIASQVHAESIQEMETRLRSDIEIQVRQEFLSNLSAAGGDIGALLRSTPSAPPVISNFTDKALQASGNTIQAPLSQQKPMAAAQTTPPAAHSTQSVAPLVRTAPQPREQKPPTSLSARQATPAPYVGELGEEAAEIFRLEAEEHLQTISVYTAALEKDLTNRELIQGVRRATHTLKGAAGMMGFRAIADLCHISEDLLDSIMEGTTSINPVVLSIILDTTETLDMLINGKGTEQSDEAKVKALRVRYTALLGEQSTPFNVNEDIDVDEIDEPITDTKLVAGVISEQFSEVNVQHVREDLSVRVRLRKLDELVNLFGELLVNRSVLEERVQRLLRLVADVGISSTRLRDVGQKLESNFEAATLPSGRSVQVMPGEGQQSNGYGFNGKGKNGRAVEPQHLAEFDELELDRYTEFHRLARGLSEGISDMTTLSAEMDTIIRECEGVFARENRLSTTFQDRLMKVRLVPLSTMTPRLYRTARAVALKQGKDFEFLLEGEETEVDRTVYEEITGPLQHLMRNAINHAIETPDVRIQKGKSPSGQVKLSAHYEGNQVVITVRDDGTGIDAEHVYHTAVARGLIRSDQVLNEGDLIDLIFRPGFSTTDILSEESGRGVGLDVVRDSVSRLRGTIEVESMPGQGTAFTMKFPTSLAIQSTMMVVIAGQQFAIPTSMVEAIGRLDNFKRSTLAGQPAILVRNDLYSLTPLAQYLSLPTGLLGDKSPLLLINAGGHRVALVVDDIKNKVDIVMKNLGPHLRQLHGIAGATVLGNGRVVLVLELAELLSTRPRIATSVPQRREGTAAPYTIQAAQVPPTPLKQTVSVERQNTPLANIPTSAPSERGKYVLIVDDSPSVRRVVGNMLKQHGWDVQMARDGVEAFDTISREIPAAVLLDIEMPRMDGYELIATIRSQEQYRTLPLVVLTSRAAAKHQQHALQLGANAYVIKPYQDEELLTMLNSLVYGAVTR